MNELKSTISQIIEENFISSAWNPLIDEELAKLKIDKQKERVDLTKAPFVTIDGEDAKDYDDAVFCSLYNSKYVLSVAIADVAELVLKGTAIDKEANIRGTSIYFPSTVIPMLPEKISNNLCSLVPDEIRNVLVCEMVFSLDGILQSYKFFEAIIKSHKRIGKAESRKRRMELQNEKDVSIIVTGGNFA